MPVKTLVLGTNLMRQLGYEAEVKLKREELYKAVWQKSMLIPAKEYGIASVALVKICKKLKIPPPGRGYWAKLEDGKKTPPARLCSFLPRRKASAFSS